MKQYHPNSPEWLVQRIKEDSNEQAVTLLRIWMPESRQAEALENTIMEIRKLNNEITTEALYNLQK